MWSIYAMEYYSAIKINETQMRAMSGEYADESELPSQAVTVFAWSSKKQVVLHYPDGRLCTFC